MMKFALPVLIGLAAPLVAGSMTPEAPSGPESTALPAGLPTVERSGPIELGAPSPGACCVGTICIPNLSPENCYDTGGVWQGEFIGCGLAICVEAPPCPSGASPENEGDCGQPQPDNYNGGPNSPSCIFFPDFGGDANNITVCSTTSADRRNQSNRDTDWLRLIPIESTEYTACALGQSGMEVQFWQLGSIVDPCGATTPQNAAAGNAGTNVCAAQCLLAGQQFAIRSAAVFNAIGSQTHEPQRLGIACVRYNLSLSTAACAVGACCNPDVSCTDGIVGVDCLASGGEYSGDGSLCPNVDCGGACCLPNGICVIQSRTNCATTGGSYTVGAQCFEVQPCPICQPEDPNDLDGVDGTDESCTLGDMDVNPGCSDGTLGHFTPLDCNETLCGRAGVDGGFRDLDWYHIEVTQETEMLITVNNGLIGGGTLLFRFRYYPNQQPSPVPPPDPCNPAGAFEVVPAARGNQLPAGQTVIPIVVPAGRYTMLVAYDFSSPGMPVVPCPGNYRVTFDCAATPCAFVCDTNAVNVENEPNCGDPTQVNEGCSVGPTPGAFTPLGLNQRVCGTARLVRTSSNPLNVSRDVDWYRITLPAGDWVLAFQAEFHALLVMTAVGSDSATVCTNPNLFALVTRQCQQEVIDLLGLPAGAYGILVAPDFGSYAWFVDAMGAQEACTAPYQLAVMLPPDCPGCGDSNCDGFVTIGDIGFFVAAVVGGQGAWEERFLPGQPACDFLCSNDTNRDGFVTIGDIGTFVAAVTGTPCQN